MVRHPASPDAPPMGHDIPMEFICDRCGNSVATDDSGADDVRCSECGAQFDAPYMVAIQRDREPAADHLRASQMLGRDKDWIEVQRQNGELAAIYNSGIVGIAFPLSALKSLATKHGLEVRPLAESGALLVPRRSS